MRSTISILDEQAKSNNLAIESEADALESPRIGFTPYAEILNGRLAMIGFVSLLSLALISKHGLIAALTSL